VATGFELLVFVRFSLSDNVTVVDPVCSDLVLNKRLKIYDLI
jgi:hypothetical protein